MTDEPVSPSSTSGGPAPLAWDPYDEAIGADPHPVWHRLREEAPLYRNDRHDFWALSRFEDCDAAHRDPERFSSAHGTVLELMTEDAQTGPLMIFLDPPDHTWLRRLVSRAFTPRRVLELEDGIRALCARLLESWSDAGFDLVSEYGAIIPGEVIAELLGVPIADREQVRHWIDGSFYLEPNVGMMNDTAAASWGKLHDYLTTLLKDRVRTPRDDMLSDLLAAEYTDDEGVVRKLGLEGATMFGLLLISAGTETVGKLIGWAAMLLGTHRDEQAAVAADRSLIPGAVEEVLRFEAPSPVQGRWTTCDMEFHGTPVPAGSKVLLLTASAGRDPRAYPEPDHFAVRRVADRHLSFGYGAHFCLGAALARLEGRVALEELFARHPAWEVDLDAAEKVHTSTVRGYVSLPAA